MIIVLNRKRLILSVIAIFIAALCASLAFYSIPTAAEVKGVSLPIIMYHGLCPDKERQNKYIIDPSYFEEDLIYLKEQGYETVLLREVIDHFKKGTPLPEKPVLLTFDDGYMNNYTYAYPLLQKYSAKAVISPIAAETDKEDNNLYRDSRWSQCSWDELKEMSDSGLVEIENHTYDLHNISDNVRGAAIAKGENEQDYEKRLKADLSDANKRIERHIGKAANAFVYPYGAKSETTEEIVKSMGFEAILDCENKINILSSPDDLYHLHRFIRTDNISVYSLDIRGWKII